ncbi:hypothetical protein [Nocardia sp. NPDC056100]|uniref:hypothetical protein n=1 Tax=Nocardia sp. NPDC056100 TaxID=3345712 RepID=UPI0035DD1031
MTFMDELIGQLVGLGLVVTDALRGCSEAENLAVPDPNFWIYLGDEPVRDSGLSFNQWLRSLADYLPAAIELRQEFGL